MEGFRSSVARRLGPYRVLEEIGRGGMAQVFLGEHELLGRRAALKVLSGPAARLLEARRSFLREARVASVLHHDNLVEVYDFGQQGGHCFAVMELLEGETLADRLSRREPTPMTLIFGLAKQLARALEALHGHGIVHCDVKPENIVLVSRRDGPPRLKLIDYGICMEVETGRRDQDTAPRLIGTPEYMAPEQIAGDQVVPRTDVYAFGVVLYEMLIGEPPFHGALRDVLVGSVADDPPSLPLETPPELARLITSCLAKDPAERPSVRAVLAALEDAEADYEQRADAVDRALREDREGSRHPSGDSRDTGIDEAWFTLDGDDPGAGAASVEPQVALGAAATAPNVAGASTFATSLFLLLVTACLAAIGGYFLLGHASLSH